jgi:hypothetical protein
VLTQIFTDFFFDYPCFSVLTPALARGASVRVQKRSLSKVSGS